MVKKSPELIDVFKSFVDFSFNKIDMLILIYTFNRKLSVEELRSELDIAYKNILPHLRKLESYGLIIITDNGLGKKKDISANIKDKVVKDFIESLIAVLGTIQLNLDKK